MIASIIAGGLKIVAGTAAFEGFKAVITKIASSPNEVNNKKDILKTQVAMDIVKDILNAKTEITIAKETDKKAVQQFLLKLGVHVKEIDTDTLTLSKGDIEKLQKNINHIEDHLGGFGVNAQGFPVVLNDLNQKFQNFIKKNSDKNKKSEELKNERIANKVVTLLNHSDNNNPLDTASYVEGIGLRKLLEPFITDNKNDNKIVTSNTVLQTILHAEIFVQNNDKKITYEKFNDTIRLPENVGISKSDFYGFKNDTKNIPNSLKDFKTTIKKSDFGTDINPLLPPKGVTVILNYDDFFGENATLDDKHKEYIKNNAKNIFIKVDDATQLLKAYKKIKDIDKDSKVNFTNKDDDTAPANKLDDLFKFIKKLPPQSGGTNEKLIFDAIKAETQVAKDNGFKAIIVDKDKYDAIKSEYPDFMKKIFKNEMKQHTELGEFVTKQKITEIFVELKKSEFKNINKKSDIIQKYLYSAFLKSDDYKKLSEQQKLEFLERINSNINDNTSNKPDLQFLIGDALRKLNTDGLDQKQPTVQKIISNKEINSFFDKNYDHKNGSDTLYIQKLLLGDGVLQKGKQDRYDIYSAFIKKNTLDENLNSDTPQELAKLILTAKLIPELEGLKKVNGVKDNVKINENIKELLGAISKQETEEINKKLKKYFPDSTDITSDTITAEQLQKLLNSF